MSDELLILHCSPTLAGIKTGNLFSCRVNSRDELNRDIRRVNKKLVPKGLRLIPFRCEGGRALLYLYRPERLARDLQESTPAGYSTVRCTRTTPRSAGSRSFRDG